jgi:hypothetical protein
VRQQVIVSEFNKLEGNRYFDVESQTSFEVDHVTQVRFAGIADRGGMYADMDTLAIGSFCGAVIRSGVTKFGAYVSRV